MHLSARKECQDFITKKMDWDDTSDSDKEVNYALMVNVESSSETSNMKVPHSILAFDTEDTELRFFLENMDVSFRDQTLENERIKSENERIKSESPGLKKRNDYLINQHARSLEGRR